MKKSIYTITLLALFGLSSATNGQTSVASGNWTSPATWGGNPPMQGDIVVINHTVTLDLDYGYSTGSITIGPAGTLIGNSAMRGLSVMGGSLTVNGIINIARMTLQSGVVTNNGTFQNDSLLNITTFTNSSGATINAGQFMIATGGTFNNSGEVVSSAFLNVSTTTNSGTLTSTDIMNSKNFTNSSTGLITAFDFLNSDSLSTSVVFTNNGVVTVNNDWANIKANSASTTEVNGSGKFCIQRNSYNSGTMSGTFDFCDQTGGNIDYNIGTIASTITNCLYSCATAVNEGSKDLFVRLFPNPNNGIFSILCENSTEKNEIEIYNILGEKVYRSYLNATKTEIDFSNEEKGVYFFQITNGRGIKNTGKIIVE